MNPFNLVFSLLQTKRSSSIEPAREQNKGVVTGDMPLIKSTCIRSFSQQSSEKPNTKTKTKSKTG